MSRQGDQLRDGLGRFMDAVATELATELHGVLVETTPVDTGAARDGWEIRPGGPGQLDVANDEEHIEFLNRGSSPQAPAGFIEAAREQAIANVRARLGRSAVRARSVQVRAPGVGRGARR